MRIHTLRKSKKMLLEECLSGLDALEGAAMHIREGFSLAMPRQDAQNYFDAYSILLKLRVRVYNESEGLSPSKEGPITQREIDAALVDAKREAIS